MKTNYLTERLRHHVTGAIERGESTPIVGIPVTYEVFHGGARLVGNTIMGPFSVTVIKDDGKRRSIVSSRSNIATAQLCDAIAANVLTF